MILLGLVLVALLAGGALCAVRQCRAPRVTQPVPFNHKKHMETVKCSACHRFYETRPVAGMPRNADCMECHEDPMSKHPEEARQRKEYWEAGREIPWVQVNRLPGHVYFSHAAHVAYGKMDCAVCHGDMKERSEAVTVSQIGHLDMKACVECHERKGAASDCVDCHQ